MWDREFCIFLFLEVYIYDLENDCNKKLGWLVRYVNVAAAAASTRYCAVKDIITFFWQVWVINEPTFRHLDEKTSINFWFFLYFRGVWLSRQNSTTYIPILGIFLLIENLLTVLIENTTFHLHLGQDADCWIE